MKTKKHPSKRMLVLVYGCCVLLVAVAAFGLWQNLLSGHTATQRSAVSSQAKHAAVSDLQDRNFTKARQTLANTPDANSKTNLLLQAQAAIGERNYNLAIETYKKSVKQYGMDAGMAINLGQAETFNGDKQAALGYYRQAETLLSKKSDDASKESLAGVQSLIKQLQM